jgi:predicted secreted hydrolase
MKPNPILFWFTTFLSALPGYHYRFPADDFNHPAYQTEWWYYTGNLRDQSGHRYGFELTFFRQAVQLPPAVLDSISPTWRPAQIYLAHLALTDVDRRVFFHTERLNRAGPGLAGSDLSARKYWNGNWQVFWTNLATGEQRLQAICDQFTLTLDLSPLKPRVINGVDGISQKGPAPGEASHYISFTRVSAQGHLTLEHASQTVTGLAWIDHEFFTEQPDPALAGWDWFAIQLAGNEELMLYRLREKSGKVSPYSSGTYVDGAGAAHHLTAAEIVLTPGRLWHKYPVEWRIAIPSLALQLTEKTTLDNQELTAPPGPSPSYWEGAVTYAGTSHGKPIDGLGYLEMTGYAEPFRLGR